MLIKYAVLFYFRVRRFVTMPLPMDMYLNWVFVFDKHSKWKITTATECDRIGAMAQLLYTKYKFIISIEEYQMKV